MALRQLTSYVALATSGVSVPPGYEAYGAWTELITLPERFDGLEIQVLANNSGTNQAWALGLGPPGSSAPSSNGFIQNMVMLQGTGDIVAPVYHFPIPVAGGAILYAQSGANGNEASQSLGVWGIPAGSLTKEQRGQFKFSDGFNLSKELCERLYDVCSRWRSPAFGILLL